MLIQRAKVVLAKDYRNVLVEDFEEKYEGADALNKPGKVVEVMNKVFRLSEMAEEYVYLVCMTTANRPIRFFEISHGTCSMAPAGIREIFIRVLLCGAAGMILVHNHPSGDCVPSADDMRLTKKVQEAAKLMEIKFCDHIIIGRDSYYSFKEQDGMG